MDRTATPDPDDPRATWDRLSPHYDRQLWLEQSAVATAVGLLAPGPDERCLDLGTGTGEVLRALQRRGSPPGTVIGLDASAGMLARVGPLPAGWSLQRGDVRRLDLPDASFDAASAAYLLHLLTAADRTAGLAEIRRVLRPGGRLVTVTPAIPARGIARPLAAALDALSERRPTAYRGLRALDPRPALARAGFRVAETRWNLRGYPSICVLATRPAEDDGDPTRPRARLSTPTTPRNSA
jgi:ubiquinone/menaquinone biosynthesis C-methylase UbiE